MGTDAQDLRTALSLEELCYKAGGLTRAEIEHFRALVAVWQILADLSFADLLLLAPITGDPDRNLLVLAQIRPDTTQTLYPDDHVGTALLREYSAECDEAIRTGSVQTTGPDQRGVMRFAIPVRGPRRTFPGVILREGRPFGGRQVSVLEEAYARCAEALEAMVVDGVFPFEGMADWDNPRVGDGLMVLDPDGTVGYASPNAIAAHRRLGIH
jgi:two-component system, sensor histidine kinase PdtaS